MGNTARLILFVTLFLLLQFELWFSSRGVVKTLYLYHQVQIQKQADQDMEKKLAALQLEIHNLKKNPEAIEAHARNDLGMIKKGEVFYRLVPKKERRTRH